MKHFETQEQHAAAIGAGPEVTRKDLSDFSAATRRVFDLLVDGRYHSASEIIAVSQIREGVVRVRELRLCGYVINKRRLAGSRDYEYIMVLDSAGQPVQVAGGSDEPDGELGALGKMIRDLIAKQGQHRIVLPGGAVMTWASETRELSVGRAVNGESDADWGREIGIFASTINKLVGARVHHTFKLVYKPTAVFRMETWKMPDPGAPIQQELFA